MKVPLSNKAQVTQALLRIFVNMLGQKTSYQLQEYSLNSPSKIFNLIPTLVFKSVQRKESLNHQAKM